MPKAFDFTDRGIKAVKPTTARLEIRDGKTTGLCLVVQPSGHRSFAFRYRSPLTGKPAKLTLGAYPGEISLDKARDAALDARRAVKAGRDPSVDKKTQRRALGNSALSTDTLLDEFVKAGRSRGIVPKRGKWRPSTADEIERLIEKRIKPAWKGRGVQSITRGDVTALLTKMATTGAPVSANRTLAVIRLFFRWLIEQDVLAVSPADSVGAPTAERSRDRILADVDVRALWQATADGGTFSSMVRLLLLTGQRRGEVAGMRWDELILDGETPEWTIPADRAKNKRQHTVPLSPAAVALIRSVKAVEGSEFVFTTTGETPISGFSKGKQTVNDAMSASLQSTPEEQRKADIASWRLHDLRRTFASGMAQMGQPIHVVERLLNHVSGSFGGIVGVYQRYDFATEKRAAMIAWAERVASLVTLKAN